MRLARTAARSVLAAWAVWAGGVTAQQGCQFVEGSGNLTSIDSGSGPVTYVRTPNLVCRDGVRIRADSAVSYKASDMVQLIGRVRFDDPERRLNARSAEYFSGSGRLQAHGGASLLQKEDSSLVTGDDMTYLREGPGRATASLDVVGDRPTARLRLQAKDGARAPGRDSAAAPYDIVADRIRIEGESYFRARGRVEITRDSLRAYADSVEYDEVAGTLRLMSSASMTIEGRELSGSTITAAFEGNDVREVEAKERGQLTGSDVSLRAPVVRVYFEDGAMGRVVAVDPTPPSAASSAERPRPTASAESFVIVADSLDVLAPGEALDRIHAAGRARAESTARDSLNAADTPPLARSDWMEGDTIDARFERDSAVAVADSAGAETRLRSLAANGKARSLYRMPASDSARARGETRPAIHYVTAQAITLQMEEGEVHHMEVTGKTEGVHAEPSRPVGSAPSGSSAPPPNGNPPDLQPGNASGAAPPPRDR